MNKIDGTLIAKSLLNELTTEIAELKSRGITPGLAVVLVGDNPASQVYVNSKVKKCAELGMLSRKIELPASTSQEELLALIHQLNEDESIHGILVQSPPPEHINEAEIVAAIRPEKDVDGFHAINVAKLTMEDPTGFVPCTPAGCMELLKAYNISTKGKNAVVVGRSMIVGKPMALLLMARGADATVTVAHSKTTNLAAVCRQADILVAAIGKAEFINRDYVKPGAVVIDVGINRIADSTKERGYRIVGDVDYNDVKDICSHITPVPGGVGPMTIAMLMKNTLKAARQLNA